MSADASTKSLSRPSILTARPRGSAAFPAYRPPEQAHSDPRAQAFDALMRTVPIPGITHGERAQVIEADLDAMTIPERIRLEIELKERARSNFSSDYDAGPW